MNHPTPTYGPPPRDMIQSVDLALRLIYTLRDRGSVRISDIAEEFGVSPSTVHRSMGMLVYRGYATKSESRAYLPGPALDIQSIQPGLGEELVRAATSHLKAIAAETGETVNLSIRVGDKSHFIHSIEGTHPVRVGTRKGQVMPANQNSGGLAELPELSASELRALYPDMGDEEFTKFRRILHKNRKRGFSVNHGIFEHDVSAVGACLFNELGDPLGAISISIPTERFLSVQRKCTESLLTYTRDLNRKFEVLKVRI